jgi:hypothetical protein
MKQFLLVVDEEGVKRLMPMLGGTINLIEVQGMALENNPNFKALVTPEPPPHEIVPQDLPVTDLGPEVLAETVNG